ncbi:2529_t:CDS:2, partial [Racocetra persica]
NIKLTIGYLASILAPILASILVPTLASILSSNTKYQYFTNAFAYKYMIINKDPTPNRSTVCDAAAKE